MRLFIKTKERETIVKGVKEEHTILDLKRQIAHLLSIAVSRQRLVFAGEELQDANSLKQYNIQKDAIIHLVLRKPKPKCESPSTQVTPNIVSIVNNFSCNPLTSC